MRRLRPPKDRHAKINFKNWGSPPAGLPTDASAVTFERDSQGNIRAYVEDVTGLTLTAGKLAGRGASSGSGGLESITLGSGLSMSGTTLAVTGSAGSESELWAPPSVADAFDDEFSSGSLGAGWTLYDSDGSTTITPSGSIDPYASFGGAAARIQTNSYRRSWLAAQVGNDGAYHYLMKAWTPNTNDFIWARLGHTLKPDTAANDATIVLMLMAATAGHPDPDNKLGVFWVPNGGVGNYASRMFSHKTTAAVEADVYNPGAVYITTNAYTKGTYVGIQKRSTTYDFWIFDGVGTGYWLMSTTFAPTLAYAGFAFIDNTTGTTKPGNAIFYADFIRLQQNTSTFLP